MKRIIYILIISSIFLISSCGKKMTFEDQIKQDVYEKIASGYCETDKIGKDAEIKNLQIGEITPIGDTGMIDVSLEFDVTDIDGVEKHIIDSMLYLKKGNSKEVLAIFCDYDFRENK